METTLRGNTLPTSGLSGNTDGALNKASSGGAADYSETVHRVNRCRFAIRLLNVISGAFHEQHRLYRRRSRHHHRHPGIRRFALKRQGLRFVECY